MFNIKAICVVYLILRNIKAGHLNFHYKTFPAENNTEKKEEGPVCIVTQDMDKIPEELNKYENYTPQNICCTKFTKGEKTEITKADLEKNINDLITQNKIFNLTIGFHNSEPGGAQKLKGYLTSDQNEKGDGVLYFNFTNGELGFLKVLLAMGTTSKFKLHTRTMFADCRIDHTKITVDIYINRTKFFIVGNKNKPDEDQNQGQNKPDEEQNQGQNKPDEDQNQGQNKPDEEQNQGQNKPDENQIKKKYKS